MKGDAFVNLSEIVGSRRFDVKGLQERKSGVPAPDLLEIFFRFHRGVVVVLGLEEKGIA